MLKATDLYLGKPAAGWKNHDPYTLRDFRAFNLPTIITIREPADAVISWALYHGDTPTPQAINHRLALYTAWHRVAAHEFDPAQVWIADFDEFIAAPTRPLGAILPPAADYPGDAAILEAVRRDNTRDATDLRLANTPSAKRDALKQAYRSFLGEPSVVRNLAQAREAVQVLRSLSPTSR